MTLCATLRAGTCPRRRCGRGFTYTAPDGTTIDDKTERARLKALAVPPAYEKVWICPKPNGHLQATGYDTRDRKQYRYHPDWTAFRSTAKYTDLPAFGEALPRIRRRIARDLHTEAGEESFALAAVVAMIAILILGSFITLLLFVKLAVTQIRAFKGGVPQQ